MKPPGVRIVAFCALFHALLDRGIMLAASKYEAWFVTLAHTDQDIADTLQAIDDSMDLVAQQA